jgi:hypothetical protein
MRQFRTVVAAPLALVLGALSLAGAALAANQVRSATYKGALTPARDGVAVSFKVSRSGGEVTSLGITNVPLYCEGGGPPIPARFKDATISSKGTFTSTAEVRIALGPLKGQIGEKLRITGKFLKGGKERGVLTTTYPKAHQCSGSSSYATKA